MNRCGARRLVPLSFGDKLMRADIAKMVEGLKAAGIGVGRITECQILEDGTFVREVVYDPEKVEATETVLSCREGDYEIRGNKYVAIAININDAKDSHYFDIDPDVYNNAFNRAIAWAFEGI